MNRRDIKPGDFIIDTFDSPCKLFHDGLVVACYPPVIGARYKIDTWTQVYILDVKGRLKWYDFDDADAKYIDVVDCSG